MVHRAERRCFWEAIASGQYSEAAARTAGVSPPLGGRWFRECGGMPPSPYAGSAPARSTRYLSIAEREELAMLRAQGLGVRAIALRRAPSTIFREVRRNEATRSGGFAYRATTAQWHAECAARRPKVARLAVHDVLRTYVTDRLSGTLLAANGVAIAGPTVLWKTRRHGPRQHRCWALAWSPEQISQRLRVDFPDDPTMRISHEAIYQAL